MMRSPRWFILAAFILFSTVFCGLGSTATPPGPEPETATPVEATSTEAAETLLPPSGTGAISGHLSYPSEFIPELRVVAFDMINLGIYYYVDTVQNQSVYQIDSLPPGKYHVVAYVLDPTLDVAGGYSQFIPCGAHYGCDDHTLLDVVVTSGTVTEDINPSDWYAPAGAFPPRPGP
jgi:hypothetical protein